MSDFSATVFFDVGPEVPPGSGTVTVPFGVTVRPPTLILSASDTNKWEPTRVYVAYEDGGPWMDPEN